ncbi:MAG: cytochrome P450 [Ktedonobacteraceae bacterium]|nr:cytochrome P450 [Ktedonobacteraceae bacterium]
MQQGHRLSTHALEQILQSYAWFSQMRENQPVFYDERTHLWHVFRYNDVQQVLTDHQRFSSQQRAGTPTPFTGSFIEHTLVAKDPPDHRKLRNIVNLAFTPRAVASLSERITAITQELLDRARARGSMDAVTDFAFPLPATVIAEMLGIPAEDKARFQHWIRGIGTNPSANRQEAGQRMRITQQELFDYFSHLLEVRRKEPREDLLSVLSNAEVDGERLSELELVSFCILLLFAGHETTVNLLANAILCLTDFPDSLERLKREPELIPAAIEEVLRYLSPVWNLFRLTTTDVELSGQRIPANQVMLAWLASANRDPAQFPDADRFDIQREPNRHLAFGHGIHFCLGAPLARLEARIALPMILQQLPGLQRVTDAPITVQTGIIFAIKNLPVTFQSQ